MRRDLRLISEKSSGFECQFEKTMSIKDRESGYRHRHPDNPYGQGSPEFWNAEVRLYGFDTKQEYFIWKKSVAPICPHCGIPQGFAPGTGDCGMES